MINSPNPNYNTIAQSGFSSDTYLAGSETPTLISGQFPQAGTLYHCIFSVNKTAAGIATPIITLRYGTTSSITDAAICTFTFPAQTGATDVGTFEVWAVFRTAGTGTSAVVQGVAQLLHTNAITGFSTGNAPTLQVTSSGFNSRVANSVMGISVNGGSSASWTVQFVSSTINNI